LFLPGQTRHCGFADVIQDVGRKQRSQNYQNGFKGLLGPQPDNNSQEGSDCDGEGCVKKNNGFFPEMN